MEEGSPGLRMATGNTLHLFSHFFSSWRQLWFDVTRFGVGIRFMEAVSLPELKSLLKQTKSKLSVCQMQIQLLRINVKKAHYVPVNRCEGGHSFAQMESAF